MNWYYHRNMVYLSTGTLSNLMLCGKPSVINGYHLSLIQLMRRTFYCLLVGQRVILIYRSHAIRTVFRTARPIWDNKHNVVADFTTPLQMPRPHPHPRQMNELFPDSSYLLDVASPRK